MTYHLGLDHVSHGLIESVHLLRLKVTDDGADVVEDLLDEGHDLKRLNLHKIMRLKGGGEERM